MDNMDYNKLSAQEILNLYHGVSYWCYRFPGQFIWLVLGYLISYVANGGILIRIGIGIYFIIGVYLYFHYKEIESFLKENNPYRKGKEK